MSDLHRELRALVERWRETTPCEQVENDDWRAAFLRAADELDALRAALTSEREARIQLELHHIGAIDRAIVRLQQELDHLAAHNDYNVMFPEGDIKSLEEVKSFLHLNRNHSNKER